MHCTRTESIYRRKGMGWGGTHDRKGQDVTLRGSLLESKRNEQDKSERGEAAMAADCCRRRRHCRRPEPHLCCCWPHVVAAADGLRPLHGLTSRPSAAWPLRGLRPLQPLRGQRPLRGHSGRCAASRSPAAAGSIGSCAAHLQQPLLLLGCWAAVGLLHACMAMEPCMVAESSGD